MKKIHNFFNFIAILLIIIIIIFKVGVLIVKKVSYPLSHFDIVKQEATKNGIDPYLVMAIIKTESGFNKDATSNKEAKGLMQIMDSTANYINNKTNVVSEIGDNLYDENVNISLGCKYFNTLVNRYNGNYYLAICAYNAGMGNVDKWINQGIIDNDLNEFQNVNLPFSETENYLKKVMRSYNMYRKLYK